jgi:hypothetical protein
MSSSSNSASASTSTSAPAPAPAPTNRPPRVKWSKAATDALIEERKNKNAVNILI